MIHQKPHSPRPNGVLRLAGKALEVEQVPKTWFSLPMPMVDSKRGRIHKDMLGY